jgi:hypothetical protein
MILIFKGDKISTILSLLKFTANTRPRLNQLLTFDQTEFFYGYDGPAFMDTEGYLYIPRQCQRQKCFLHFYFHGCLTGRYGSYVSFLNARI